MKILKQLSIAAMCATSIVLTLWGPLLVADDTEIYHGSEDVTGSVPPNILLLLDTSGSMEGTYLQPRTEYDPAIAYPGTDKFGNTCHTDRIYRLSGAVINDGCGATSEYFLIQHLECESAVESLNTTGRYQDHLAGYRAFLSASFRSWSNAEPNDSRNNPTIGDYYVDCMDDAGIHGDGNGTASYDAGSRLFSVPEDNDDAPRYLEFAAGAPAPWISTESSTNPPTGVGSGAGRILLHPNYLRYLSGYDDLNNNGVYDTGEGYDDPVPKVYIEVLQEAMLQLLENWHDMKVGIARYNGDEGGSIIHPVVAIDENNNRRQLQQAVCDLWENPICVDTYGLTIGEDRISGGTPHTEALYEAFSYFRGHRVEYGDQSHEYRQSVESSKRSADFYDSPVEYTCQFNAIVHMTDGEPSHNGAADGWPYLHNPNDPNNPEEALFTRDVDTAVKALAGFSGLPSGDSTCESDGNSNTSNGITPDSCMDELAEYMANVPQDVGLFAPDGSFIQNITAQPIRTYTIGFDISLPHLQDTAAKGNGLSFTAESASEMRAAFDEVVSEIVQTGTAFISPPGVAVQSQSRTRHLNALVFNLFQPLESPHYEGNLKRYEIALDASGDPVIVDFLGNSAVDPDTGGFLPSARSWWSVDEDGITSVADGNDVVKGGARSQFENLHSVCSYLGGSSKFICAAANRFSNANMNSGNITANDLMLPPGHENDLNLYSYWAGGMDAFDDDNDGDESEPRRHMGDPLHAQPTLITYDSDKNDDGIHSDPDTLIFTMTNDGFLHALDLETGEEAWRFLPKELWPNLYKAHTNIGTEKLYGLDGQFLAWTEDENDNGTLELSADHAWLFFGMRRGGRNYYALDVSLKTSPKHMWDIKGGVTPGFARLGQTWSRAQKATINLNGVVEEVLVFTGGYDENQDGAYTTMPDATMGNAVYMVRATDGALLWHASSSGADLTIPAMRYPIPAEAAVLDMNLDGFDDRMYVTDISGQVWRMDIHNGAGSASSLVTAGQVARLSEPGGMHNRKFFNQIDVAVLVDEGSAPSVVLNVGSGNRDHPLGKMVADMLFSFRDPNGNPSGIVNNYAEALGITDLKDVSILPPDDEQDAFFDEVMTLYKGWYINLPPGGAMNGEKALAPAITVNGQIMFTTYEPPSGNVADGCELPTGTTRIYSLSLRDGSAGTDLNNDGLVDSDDDRAIEVDHEGIASGVVVIFPEATDGAPVSMSGNKIIPTEFQNTLRRSYWYTPTRDPAN